MGSTTTLGLISYLLAYQPQEALESKAPQGVTV